MKFATSSATRAMPLHCSSAATLLLALCHAPSAFAEPSPTSADAITTSSTVDGFSLAGAEGDGIKSGDHGRRLEEPDCSCHASSGGGNWWMTCSYMGVSQCCEAPDWIPRDADCSAFGYVGQW